MVKKYKKGLKEIIFEPAMLGIDFLEKVAYSLVPYYGDLMMSDYFSEMKMRGYLDPKWKEGLKEAGVNVLQLGFYSTKYMLWYQGIVKANEFLNR